METLTQITQQQLKELLHYNEQTGIFTWVNSAARRVKKGDEAGYIMPIGYVLINITISGKARGYYAHRLAWLYIYGEMPKNQIDHINHDKADNRLVNLREATYAENHKNHTKRVDNTSGVTGVGFHKRDNRWRAYIQVNGKK